MNAKQQAEAQCRAIRWRLAQMRDRVRELWRIMPPHSAIERRLLLGAEALEAATEHYVAASEMMDQQRWNEDETE